MSRSLQDQLRSFGIAPETTPADEPLDEQTIQTIRNAPPLLVSAETSDSAQRKCEVGGWVPQELLAFGSDREKPVSHRPILLWRERDFQWVVFPGSSKEKPKSRCFPGADPEKALFYFVQHTDWDVFQNSYHYNFSKHSYFSRRYETIPLLSFDPIGRLKDRTGIQYRLWARKACQRIDASRDPDQGEFKA